MDKLDGKKSVQMVADEVGENKTQVLRYIRLAPIIVDGVDAVRSIHIQLKIRVVTYTVVLVAHGLHLGGG